MSEVPVSLSGGERWVNSPIQNYFSLESLFVLFVTKYISPDVQPYMLNSNMDESRRLRDDATKA